MTIAMVIPFAQFLVLSLGTLGILAVVADFIDDYASDKASAFLKGKAKGNDKGCVYACCVSKQSKRTAGKD